MWVWACISYVCVYKHTKRNRRCLFTLQLNHSVTIHNCYFQTVSHCVQHDCLNLPHKCRFLDSNIIQSTCGFIYHFKFPIESEQETLEKCHTFTYLAAVAFPQMVSHGFLDGVTWICFGSSGTPGNYHMVSCGHMCDPSLILPGLNTIENPRLSSYLKVLGGVFGVKYWDNHPVGRQVSWPVLRNLNGPLSSWGMPCPTIICL